MTNQEQPPESAIPAELRERVQELVNMAFDQGVNAATTQAKQENSALVDALQVALSDPTIRSELEKQGKISKAP